MQRLLSPVRRQNWSKFGKYVVSVQHFVAFCGLAPVKGNRTWTTLNLRTKKSRPKAAWFKLAQHQPLSWG